MFDLFSISHLGLNLTNRLETKANVYVIAHLQFFQSRFNFMKSVNTEVPGVCGGWGGVGGWWPVCQC